MEQIKSKKLWTSIILIGHLLILLEAPLSLVCINAWDSHAWPETKPQNPFCPLHTITAAAIKDKRQSSVIAKVKATTESNSNKKELPGGAQLNGKSERAARIESIGRITTWHTAIRTNLWCINFRKQKLVDYKIVSEKSAGFATLERQAARRECFDHY